MAIDPNKIPNMPMPDVPAADFLNKLHQWQMPSQNEFVSYLTNLGTVQSVILLACGLVYLLYGWKVFRVLVMVNAALLGAALGSKLGMTLQGQNMPLFCGLAGAVVLGAMSWPLMKYAVCLMGGLAGAFLGFAVWNSITKAAGATAINNYAWVGALLGLIVMGLLAFIVFRVTIVIFTALQGSLLTVSGLVALLMLSDSLKGNILRALNDNPHLLPLLVFVPAIIGIVFQMTTSDKGPAKKPQPAKA